MKQNILLIIVSVCAFVFSCQTPSQEKFPFSEKQMLENKDCGILLEYAIYDSKNIEFVKTNICDILKQEKELCFSKIRMEINDTLYYYFSGPYEEDWNVINDYYGVFYFDINKCDSFYVYNFESKYSINDFDLIIDKLASKYEKAPLEILTNRKVGNTFTPSVYFIIDTKSMNCEESFVENVIEVNRFINNLMNSYAKRKFPKEELKLSPYIKIRKKLASMQ